jgi:hypothetical protein
VVIGGPFQYWRNQQWKRAEFLAAEMRAFFTTPRVRNTLAMIDWGGRNIDLYASENRDVKTWPLITRNLQLRALLPHPIVNAGVDAERTGGQDAERSDVSGGDLRDFTADETAVRDCYDELLDGLERFASYAATGLIRPADLRPYLGYWIDDIASKKGDDLDLAWTCVFLSYVEFYGFTAVQRLFLDFGYDVSSRGSLFKYFLESIPDRNVATALAELLERKRREAEVASP